MDGFISKKSASNIDLRYCMTTPKSISKNYPSNHSIFITNTDIRKKARTPLKATLNLSSSCKKGSHRKINDRYIPNRVSNIEASYHLLVSARDQENVDNEDTQPRHDLDNIKRKLINDTCRGGTSDSAKILSLHTKTASFPSDKTFSDNLRALYNTTSIKKVSSSRNINISADKILDAPDFKNDFYLNLIDWSSTNKLAVALNRELYIWNALTKEISLLFSMDENTPDYVTSVSWVQKGDVVAIGTSKNTVELWDVNKKVCMRQLQSHTSRIGSLSWNSFMLSSGSRSGEIHQHDVRVSQHHISSYKLHTQEICGLKWNPDGRYLASGANDNLVAIWDTASTSNSNLVSTPLHTLREHTAAVKALAWCPWQTNILATGGGTLDQHIKIWNMYNGAVLQSHDTKSQVSALLWSKNYKELISSHGFQQNQLSLWKYPDMTKVCDLVGHSDRILGMAISPDEENVVSVGADETLRFWKCFAADDSLKKSKENLGDKKSASQTGLSRCIR